MRPCGPLLLVALSGNLAPALAGTGRVGTDLEVRFFAPYEAGAPYLAAASFSREPGIPIGGRTIPLAVDPLLLLSLSGAGVFEHVRGTLDSTGRARGVVHIPPVPALAGLRLFVAFVTLGPVAPAGVRTISAAAPAFLFP